MSEAEGARGVVLSHADMADGLVGAVRRIAGGAADGLIALSNEGKSPQQLREELDALFGDTPTLVFVDLQAGSCGMAALSCCRESDRRRVVCGVNLPMLLDFVFNRTLPLAELAERAVETGRNAIATSPSPAAASPVDGKPAS